MNYVESFNLLGLEARQITCIKFNENPTTSTEGAIGMLGMNVNSGAIYKCTNVNNGSYTWVPIEPSEVDLANYLTKDDIVDVPDLFEYDKVMSSSGGAILSDEIYKLKRIVSRQCGTVSKYEDLPYRDIHTYNVDAIGELYHLTETSYKPKIFQASCETVYETSQAIITIPNATEDMLDANLIYGYDELIIGLFEAGEFTKVFDATKECLVWTFDVDAKVFETLWNQCYAPAINEHPIILEGVLDYDAVVPAGSHVMWTGNEWKVLNAGYELKSNKVTSEELNNINYDEFRKKFTDEQYMSAKAVADSIRFYDATVVGHTMARLEEDVEMLENITDNIESMVSDVSNDVDLVRDDLNRLCYYGDKNIFPTDQSYFNVDDRGNLISNSMPNEVTDIVIPYKIGDIMVTSIGSSAFYENDSIKSIVIPEGVTTIEYQAFSDCRSLTSISLPEGVTTIDEWAFSGCSSLTSINIPDSVTKIGQWTFCNCSSLTSISLPEGITTIGEGAFSGCSSLTSIRVPDSIVSIGEDVFEEIKTNITVICKQGSIIEQYCINNNINYMYDVVKPGQGKPLEIILTKENITQNPHKEYDNEFAIVTDVSFDEMLNAYNSGRDVYLMVSANAFGSYSDEVAEDLIVKIPLCMSTEDSLYGQIYIAAETTVSFSFSKNFGQAVISVRNFERVSDKTSIFDDEGNLRDDLKDDEAFYPTAGSVIEAFKNLGSGFEFLKESLLNEGQYCLENNQIPYNNSVKFYKLIDDKGNETGGILLNICTVEVPGYCTVTQYFISGGGITPSSSSNVKIRTGYLAEDVDAGIVSVDFGRWFTFLTDFTTDLASLNFVTDEEGYPIIDSDFSDEDYIITQKLLIDAYNVLLDVIKFKRDCLKIKLEWDATSECYISNTSFDDIKEAIITNKSIYASFNTPHFPDIYNQSCISYSFKNSTIFMSLFTSSYVYDVYMTKANSPCASIDNEKCILEQPLFEIVCFVDQNDTLLKINNCTYAEINEAFMKGMLLKISIPAENINYVGSAKIFNNSIIITSANQKLTINEEGIVTIEYIDIGGGEVIDLSAYEQKSNKITTIDSGSTDEQYPSAKAVYEAVEDKKDKDFVIRIKYTEVDWVDLEKEGFLNIENLENPTTFEKIREAYDQGRTVYILYDEKEVVPLDSIESGTIMFSNTFHAFHVYNSGGCKYYADWLGRGLEDLFNEKTDKTTISFDDSTTIVEYDLIAKNNIEDRFLTDDGVSVISINVPSDMPKDYEHTSSLSFNTANTDIRVDYPGLGIINWLGSECSLIEGSSIFAPEPNKHYDIVFYFNGQHFVGLVNGFTPSTVMQEVTE